MGIRTASARAPGSIHSLEISHRVIQRTTTAATFMTAYHIGSWLRPVIWCRPIIRVRPILAKPPILAPMNTHGVSRIPGSATCLIITPIVSSQSPAGRHFSIFRLSVPPSECNRRSRRGQLRAPQYSRLSPIRVTMVSFLSVTR